MDDAPVKVLTVALAVAAVLALAAPTWTAAANTAPVLSGSFIQPPLVDQRSDQQLATEEGYLTRAGLTQQVLQWTANTGTDTTVYPSPRPSTPLAASRPRSGPRCGRASSAIRRSR